MNFAVDDARLYIVIRAGKPSPVIAGIASPRSRPAPHRRLARVDRWHCRSRLGRGPRHVRWRPQPARRDQHRYRPRSFQGMRKRSNRRRRALAHARHQQFGLLLEQLQDFPFEATIVESHARKMRAVEHSISVRGTITFHNFNCGPDHLHLRSRYLFRGLWPNRDQIPVNKRPDRASCRGG